MSFANFDDFYDICLGMMEPEEEVVRKSKLKPRIERLEVKKVSPLDANQWWKEMVREIEREKEKEREGELLHV